MLDAYGPQIIGVLLTAQLVQIGFEARLLYLVSTLKTDVERNSRIIDKERIATDGGHDE